MSQATPERPGWLPDAVPAAREQAPAGELRLRLPIGCFDAAVRAIAEEGARFVTLFQSRSPEHALVGVFALRGELVLLFGSGSAEAGRLEGSLADWWPALAWAQRELSERAQAGADGAARPPSSGRALTEPDADLLDRRVRGLDAFTIPYGPVRSGIFEAIQFQIETGGEDVLALQTRPFFKHRAMEARFKGLPVALGVHVAERVAGIAGSAYAAAFSQAVERALGVAAPSRAERWRALYGELERMACHLDVIAKQAETAALNVGLARFQILKERVQRLRTLLTGSRFARGVILPGGVRFEGMIGLEQLAGELEDFERALRGDRRLFLGTASMTDRLIGSGRLPRALVERYCGVGPVARGSGLSTDARHERPYGDYWRLGLQVCMRREGDAMARVRVRFDELFESLRILRQSIDRLRRHDGQLAAELPERGSGAACGWAEAPQGELLIWVEIEEGVLRNVHIASPSFRNWAIFDHAFPKDVLTDFAFIEHSFGLTPAGADR